VFAHAPGYVGYDRYMDFVSQQAESHPLRRRPIRSTRVSTPFRYVWPSELDLMAKLAGCPSVVDRWQAGTALPLLVRAPTHLQSGKRSTTMTHDPLTIGRTRNTAECKASGHTVRRGFGE